MPPRSEALNDFEKAVLQAIEQSPEHTIVASDIVREFAHRSPRTSCIARIETMAREGKVRISRFAGRILVHSPSEA